MYIIHFYIDSKGPYIKDKTILKLLEDEYKGFSILFYDKKYYINHYILEYLFTLSTKTDYLLNINNKLSIIRTICKFALTQDNIQFIKHYE